MFRTPGLTQTVHERDMVKTDFIVSHTISRETPAISCAIEGQITLNVIVHLQHMYSSHPVHQYLPNPHLHYPILIHDTGLISHWDGSVLVESSRPCVIAFTTSLISILQGEHTVLLHCM